MKRVLIIGGYGQFGTLIAQKLAPDKNITLILAGRSKEKAEATAKNLQSANPVEVLAADIHKNLQTVFETAKPDIVIHTAGPFQDQDYSVAKAAIKHKCHYIDLSDSRDFVTGITVLDKQAKAANILVCSGASSVPALSSAVIEKYKTRFKKLEHLEYGISTAQKTGMGLATARAVMSYTGKPFKTLIDGEMKIAHGWQGLKYRRFSELGSRPLGYCDIPDLQLFPSLYPDLRTLEFRAGTELSILHLGLWMLSWPVRWRMIKSLAPLADPLLRWAKTFDIFGTDRSGFYMELEGKDKNNNRLIIVFELTARQGHGLHIPATPAPLLAGKLAAGQLNRTGAAPCVGMVSLEELLEALAPYHISWKTDDPRLSAS
ncbi:MAG: saccharopine dehydrogenase NADP-binding domain-containing protein [Alphaproteobacteria bacterium]|nr:saccharopine dehydrogenase NADP-binding domain-containing protein [Alphaproteobacteria bacterium]MCB9975766.1 saccharopine dehydrogenase NADP-binding domain-containing protein [Rhodospirillales bacterium]